MLPEKNAADRKGGAGKPGVLDELPMIKIEPNGGSIPRPAANVDPRAFYETYYHSRDKDRIDPDKLRRTLASLNRLRKPRELHAAILGYLKNQKYHRVAIEPWMYEALALAINMNDGSDADVKMSLNYAADLAQETHNPNHLVSVADLLFRKGYFERVGSLLDEAMPKVPHRAEPIAMSINLAQKTKDPARMSDSLERLLSLGWPGQDEYFRIEAGNQVEQMVKQLRAQNKGAEAAQLEKKLEDAMSRDVFVRLTWDGFADYDISVEEPFGLKAEYTMPRTVFGGAMIKNGYGSHPEEIYVCPRGFNGKYTIRVSKIWDDPKQPVSKLTLELITHDGTAHEKKEIRNLKPSAENPPTVVTLIEGRRKRVLPYVDPSSTIMETAIDALKNSKGAAKAKQHTATKDGQAKKGAATPPAGAAKAKPRPTARNNKPGGAWFKRGSHC